MDLLTRGLFVAVGSAAILVMAVDFFTTTLSLGGARGQLTARLAEAAWKLALRARSRRVLQVAGPLILIGIALVWLLLAAVGWTLLFRGLQPVATDGGDPAAWTDLVLSFFDTFLGISTQQLQENAPPQWRVLRRLMVLHGIASLSLTLAWILPVVGAVARKRALALRISALGTDSQDILVRAWDGRDFGDLNLFLINISTELSILGQLHNAYPVLHYYHSDDNRSSLSRQIAVLDDTVTLLADHVDPEVQPTTSVGVLRSVLTDFLGTLEETFVPRFEGELPPIRTDRLEDAAIPLRDEPEDVASERRRLVAGYLDHDGIDVYDEGTGERPERHRDLLPTPVGRRARHLARVDEQHE